MWNLCGILFDSCGLYICVMQFTSLKIQFNFSFCPPLILNLIFISLIPKLHDNSKSKTAESAVNRAFSAVCFCIIFDNYIDDGYSGTNFDRPKEFIQNSTAGTRKNFMKSVSVLQSLTG